jgi:hypothetical protein
MEKVYIPFAACQGDWKSYQQEEKRFQTPVTAGLNREFLSLPISIHQRQHSGIRTAVPPGRPQGFQVTQAEIPGTNVDCAKMSLDGLR